MSRAESKTEIQETSIHYEQKFWNEKYIFFQIHPSELHRVVPHVINWLDAIEKRSNGEFLVKNFYHDCECNQAQLWTVYPRGEYKIAAIVGTRTEKTGTGEPQARIIFCTGSKSSGWADLVLDVLEQWARWTGAKRLVAHARPGWTEPLRLHGFRLRHVERVKELKHGLRERQHPEDED